MKIAVGCDHTVVETKDAIVADLRQQGHTVIDCGTYNHVRTHYPIYGRAVALQVAQNKVDLGVALCGTGIGISNSCNKVKGIRCMVVRDIYTAEKARREYNANIISFGGQIVGRDSAVNIVNAFLAAKYEQKRKEEINLIDQQIKHLNADPHLFDEIISEWEAGDYTDHEPQAKIPLPKI